MEDSFGILPIIDMDIEQNQTTVLENNWLSKVIFRSARLYLKGGGDI